MLQVVLRKMFRNKWMMLCLLIGSVISVAMLSSIPMYTDGVLQRMLTKDIEEYQQSTLTFPGYFSVQVAQDRNADEKTRANDISYFDKKINVMADEYELPILTRYTINTIDFMNIVYFNSDDTIKSKRPIKIQSISEMDKHIKLIAGRMYSNEVKDGVYEVIVTEEAYEKLGLTIDHIYNIGEVIRDNITLKAKVVGVFVLDESNSFYWQQGLVPISESLLISDQIFKKYFYDTGSLLHTYTQWYFALDFHMVSLDQIVDIAKVFEEQTKWSNEYGRLVRSFKMPVMSLLEQYKDREEFLRTILWVLQAPILMMLAFYIFMVSQLIIESDKNEIAIIKSRGGGKFHIFETYLIQGVILCVIALILGPPLGYFITRILGASNGFLEFVQRTALPTTLNIKAYIYSLFALLLFLITMLIPALMAARVSIVHYKQRKIRGGQTTVWKKYFFDFVLLAVSIYGLYGYRKQQKILDITGAKGSEIGIDPVLFMVCTFFILGAGLLFIRLYPYIVKFLFRIGKRIWSPVFYSSFVQVGRSGGKEQFLMLFIILTLSNGIFSANAARTINDNIESKVHYLQGADLRIMAEWPSNLQLMSLDLELNEIALGQNSGRIPILYKEPIYSKYSNLDGVVQATKVFSKTGVIADNGRNNVSNINIMGIVPNEFGKVAWFRNDLMSTHWFHYLNFLTENPDAVLLSNSLRDALHLKEGDTVNFRWGSQSKMKAVVYGFVEYWPTFNPKINPTQKKVPYLIVANLSFLHRNGTLEPYEVWIKKDESVTSRYIYDQIDNNIIKIQSITSLTDKITLSKNDPVLQGTNGSLNLGFVVTMTICIIGFLIYWILSIQGRVLQFGILRAMGLSLNKILGMLITEQVLVSVVSIFIGIIIGGITSQLYIPLFGIIQDSASKLLPFRVSARQEDYLKVYYLVSAMLTLGLMVLGVIISKIKISQAIKLGED